MEVFRIAIACLVAATMGLLSVDKPSAAPATPTPEIRAPLHVMTFNIRTSNAKDGPDQWEVRKSKTLKILQKYKPELIGLQEAMAGQIEDLEKAMPNYQVAGTGRLDGRAGGEFSSIMYDTTQLQLLRSDTFWLSDTPAKPGTTDWGNRTIRICTWAYFKDRKTGKFFYHFNTHLDHISQPSRVKSVELILKRIKQLAPKDPVIITGDFNAGENNPIIESIRNAGFRDTFRVLHPDENVVGTTNAFNDNRQKAKIDYIFVDDAWDVKEAAIIDDKFDGRWPSDHLPVSATLIQK